jgi:secondary thiamine-phosphate synthase enzyme
MAVVGNGRASGALTEGGTSSPIGHDSAVLSQTVSRMPPVTVPPAPPVVPAVPAAPGVSAVLPLRSLTRVVPVHTERHLEFVDITDEVMRVVAEAGLSEGFAVVFSRHTTAGIRINEHEPLLLEDMARLLEQMVPTGNYRHDDFSVRTVNLTPGERINGHSHCRSLLLGASETVPVSSGRLLLGGWQRIFLVELDGPRRREYVVQVIGG